METNPYQPPLTDCAIRKPSRRWRLLLALNFSTAFGFVMLFFWAFGRSRSNLLFMDRVLNGANIALAVVFIADGILRRKQHRLLFLRAKRKPGVWPGWKALIHFYREDSSAQRKIAARRRLAERKRVA